MCIQMGKTLDDVNRMRFDSNNFYLKSYDEMQQVLGDYPEALTNTLKIAEQCNFDFVFGENHMPILMCRKDIRWTAILKNYAAKKLQPVISPLPKL